MVLIFGKSLTATKDDLLGVLMFENLTTATRSDSHFLQVDLIVLFFLGL